MENSKQHLLVSGTSFTNVYSSSGITVGTKINIQNLSSFPLLIYIGSSPNPEYGEVILPFENYLVAAGVSGCFVKTTSAIQGVISVQSRPYNVLGTPIDERVYTGYKGLTVQSFIESNSKNGTQFEFSYESNTVDVGASLDMIFQTAGIPVLIKNRQISFTGAQIHAQVYKNPIYTGGTNLGIYNLNTDLALPTYCTAKESPAVTNTGTLVSATPVTYGSSDQGNRSTGTYGASGAERVLSLNSTYLLRITNLDTVSCKIGVYITYYEGEISSQN